MNRYMKAGLVVFGIVLVLPFATKILGRTSEQAKQDAEGSLDARFAKIQLGMTEDQVTQIMGSDGKDKFFGQGMLLPDFNLTMDGKEYGDIVCWPGEDAGLLLAYDDNGRVVYLNPRFRVSD